MSKMKKRRAEALQASGSGGIPVDRWGGPTIDPTRNVLDLVRAQGERIADLREADQQRENDLREASRKYTEEMRVSDSRRQDDLRVADLHRMDDLQKMEIAYRDQIINLHSEHTKELMIAESKRIDAIRAVDVAAVATASERATQLSTVLANQVQTSADTQRGLVATTATTIAAQLTSITTQLTDRIASLEKAQYEGAGRGQLANPQIEQLIKTVDALSNRQSVQTGGSQSSALIISYIFAGVGALVGLSSLLLHFVGK